MAVNEAHYTSVCADWVQRKCNEVGVVVRRGFAQPTQEIRYALVLCGRCGRGEAVWFLLADFR